jgi:type II secretory pathway pseudopilin PulG
MAALLVGLSVMSVLMSMALPVWSHMAKREKEEELIWRGQQYARAIRLFQQKYANAFPPSVDLLVEQRFLRKKYKDPITNDDFQLIPATGGSPMPGMIGGVGSPGNTTPQGFGGRGGTAAGNQRGGAITAPPTGAGGSPVATTPGATTNLGISGVVSKSKDTSIKIYNGRQKYNEWAFVNIQTAQSVGGNFPGGRGGGMPPGGRGRGGFEGMPGQNNPFNINPQGGRGINPQGGRGGRGTMPPLPPGRGFQPVPPGQGSPFGMPTGQPMPPGRGMQPFQLPKPPGR